MASHETPSIADDPGHFRPEALVRPRSVTGPLDRFLQAVRQHPFVVLLVLVGLPALGVGLALVRGDEYRASAVLLVGGTGPSANNPAADARATATSRSLLDLRSVAARAARGLPGTDADEVQKRVQVKAKDDADVIQVQATADSTGAAVRTANAYADAYLGFVRGIQPPSLRPAQAAVLQRAAPPVEVRSAPVVGYGLIGLLAAIPVILLGAPLLRRLDRRVKDVGELEEIYGQPVIAQIPRSRQLARRSGNRPEATTRTVGFSEEAEAFRTLRTNLRYFNVDVPVRSILVASPLPGDGKSTVARHLAVTMASMGDSVCLVHADLRKQEEGALPTTDGLSLVLAGFDMEGALTEVPIAFDPVSGESRVLVELPSGPLPPNPSELLESERMGWLIAKLEDRFDKVIVDSPALVTVSDALTLVPRVSGVLVVGGLGQTMRQAAVDLRKQIELLGGRSLGVAANFAVTGRKYYSYYGDDGTG
jgi:capsular exopolysaccharide synthesis family protein